MRNKKLFASAVIITASLFLFTACGNKTEPVNAEPTETVSEVDTEESEDSSESMEPVPSPAVEPEESLDNTLSSGSEDNSGTGEDTTGQEVEQEESEPDLGYEIISIDEVIMYATTDANLRSGPATTYDKVGSLSYAQEVTVNGKVENGDKLWYVIKTDNSEDIQMVSGSLLSTAKPQPQQSTGNNQTQQNTSAQSQQQPAQNEPDLNVGDVVGTDQYGNEWTYGGEIDYSGF